MLWSQAPTLRCGEKIMSILIYPELVMTRLTSFYRYILKEFDYTCNPTPPEDHKQAQQASSPTLLHQL